MRLCAGRLSDLSCSSLAEQCDALTNSGASEARTRAKRVSRMHGIETTSQSHKTDRDLPRRPSGVTRRCSQTPVRAERSTLRAQARGKQLSRMPGTKTTWKSWKTRSRSANKMETYKELTEQAPAFRGQSAGGPAPPSERAPTKVSSCAPKAPHLLIRRPFSRDTLSAALSRVRLDGHHARVTTVPLVSGLSPTTGA